MSDPTCPKCAGALQVFQRHGDLGGSTAYAHCDACRWQGPTVESYMVTSAALTTEALEECRHLAYLEPRDRLPTEAEEAAHRARHGDGAGWMGQCCIDGLWRRPCFWQDWARSTHNHPVRLYPVTAEYRPVAWPEVSP